MLLFGVMLSPPDEEERKLSRVLPGLVLIGGAVTWIGMRVASTANWAVSAGPPTGEKVGPISSAERIGVGFLAADQYVVAFELAAVLLTVALVAAVYIARRKPSDLEPMAARAESAGESDMEVR